MGILVTLLVGALIGWLASRIMKTDEQQGALANILIGIVGAGLGGFLFGNVLGVGSAFTSGDFSLTGLFWGTLGAVVLIGILKAVKVLK